MFQFFGLLYGLLALVFAAFLVRKLSQIEVKDKEVARLSKCIKDGATTFLKREYKTLAIFVFIMFLILYFALGVVTAIAFLLGALLSASAGFIGMTVATSTNAKTTEAAKTSLNEALKVSFSAGSVMGMTVVGLGLLGISILFLALESFFGLEQAVKLIGGFGFGASSIALFARVGGGIYTKAADSGADMVGKVEAGIPEDDPRNPAVIADLVGDNVGDVAGMGADLFESYCGAMIAAMSLGLAFAGYAAAIYPMALAGIGILASVIGNFFVSTGEKVEMSALLGALRKGTLGASVLLLLFALPLTYFMFPEQWLGLFASVFVGLLSGVLIGLSTEHYTSDEYTRTKQIAKSAENGPASAIVAGYSVGLRSTVIPILVICATVIVAFYSAGLYGVAIAAVGMLSTLGITLATDAYGPIADNAGGIAEMSKQPEKVRERTDALDSLGNTTAATGKGFAIGSAALTSLALIAAYSAAAGLEPSEMAITEPTVLVGLFIGGMLPFLFASITIIGVGKAADKIIGEVRKQFKDGDIMSGKKEPDYVACVDISTKSALKEMLVPGLIAVFTPLVFGFIFGPAALGGLLIGALVSGFLLAVKMANAGGAWDNAKKYIEKGAHGGKGSYAHKAAVVGDLIGDPFKDTAGPSLNILIKLMSIISLIFAALISRYYLFQFL